MSKKLLTIAIVALLLAFGLSPAVFATHRLGHTQGTGNDGNVTICHRTNSVTNPYIKQTVSESAVDGIAGNSGNEADHYGEHQGPLASSEAVAQSLKDAKIEWGDIIPPVAGVHSGLNWTVQGQAMYNNNCNYVPPVITPGSPPSTPGTPQTPGGNTLGSTTGVVSSEAATTPVPTGGVNAGDKISLNQMIATFVASTFGVALGAIKLREQEL